MQYFKKIIHWFVFLKSLFFCNAEHSVHSSASLDKKDCSLHNINHLAALDKIFPLSQYFESVDSPRVDIRNRMRSVSVATLQRYPAEEIWYLPLGKRHLLSSSWPEQYPLFKKYFLYNFAGTKSLTIEFIAWKPGFTCKITAAIWLLSSFLNKRIWKKVYYYFLYKRIQKGKRFHIWKCQLTMTKKRKNPHIWTRHVTKVEKNAFIGNKLQFLNRSSTFAHENESRLSAKDVLFCSPQAYITTASLDKLTCTDSVDFGKCQHSFGKVYRSNNFSNFWMYSSKISSETTLKTKS